MPFRRLGPRRRKFPSSSPVVNFGEFVMAMQTFAAQNPPAARLAAEALSAKFTSNLDAQNEVQETTRQAVAKPASIIVTRPVIVANILTASDSAIEPPTVPDPVKVVTGFPVEHAAAAPRRRKAEKNKAEKKATETSSVRSERPFQPAMGLGMVIDTAEGAPPISVLAQKREK